MLGGSQLKADKLGFASDRLSVQVFLMNNFEPYLGTISSSHIVGAWSQHKMRVYLVFSYTHTRNIQIFTSFTNSYLTYQIVFEVTFHYLIDTRLNAVLICTGLLSKKKTSILIRELVMQTSWFIPEIYTFDRNRANSTGDKRHLLEIRSTNDIYLQCNYQFIE